METELKQVLVEDARNSDTELKIWVTNVVDPLNFWAHIGTGEKNRSKEVTIIYYIFRIFANYMYLTKIGEAVESYLVSNIVSF